MNSKISHTDINAGLLKKYYDGTLSEAEKNALEKRALDDPFLKDAMEGYESVPGSFEAFYTKHIPAKTRFSSIYLLIGSLITVALVSVLVLLHHNPAPTGIAVTDTDSTLTDSVITREVEVLPAAIDTLAVAADTEQIKLKEVVEARTEIQKTITYPEAHSDVPILIKENDERSDDYVLEPEEHNLKVQELVPATYLFELFVVDYRRITRVNTRIIYTKYEFTGTSAEYESEALEQHAELLETEVDVSYWEYLSKAMESFSNGNYKSALNRYETILTQYNDDFNALFYGGLCYYNLGNFNKALVAFDKILQTDLNAFKEEAAWYKSKCLIKLGRKSEARNLLDEIIAGGGFYVQDAITQRMKFK
ncbi:MAG: CDC27 family protein [Bacteroidetes bacterium]|nr:CDC27 family protein [Bacteroidota bacterium]